METKIPVWLDCDPGHDDAFAILFAAHHPRIELLGVSTIHGNASVEKTTWNALSVLEAIGRPEVSVYPGTRRPFCRPARHAPAIHGDTGLDGTDLLPKPSRKPVTKCNPIVDMYEALSACPADTAWLVATGALTNAALLFSTFPDLAAHIKGFNVMGGAIGDDFTSVPLGPAFDDGSGKLKPRIGNHTPYAEFNIWCDPESAESLFSNHVLSKKTMIAPLDLTHQAFADSNVQRHVLYGESGSRDKGYPSKLRQMLYDLLMFFAKTYADVFDLKEGPPLHDPLAVAFVLAKDSDAMHRIPFHDNDGERWTVTVELAGVEAGRTKISKAANGVVIPRSLDTDQFWSELIECIDTAEMISAMGKS